MAKQRNLLCASLLFLLLLGLSPFLSAADTKSCDEVFSATNCKCVKAPDDVIELECFLLKEQSLSSLFKSINATSLENLGKVIVKGCQKPIDFVEQLPSLKIRSLEISHCGIKRVHEKAFEGMADSLEELNLSSNEIDVFPALKKLRNLNSINLNHNKLKDVPERALDGLDKLHLLRLKHNRICMLLPNALAEIKSNLELLDLGRNCFSVVPYQNLKNFKSLTHLSLVGNQIADISQGQFADMPNLVELRMNSNRLKHIAPNAFVNLPKLKRFLAKDNLLQSLDSQVFSALKELEVLDLRQNSFEKVPVFKGNPKLAVLGIENNNIKNGTSVVEKAVVVKDVAPIGKNEMNFLSKLLPGLANGMAGGGGGSMNGGTIPALNSITQALPGMREIPGLNFLNQKGGMGTDKNFDAALKDFSDPLVKFATGGEPVAGDVSKLIKSIPNLVVNIPGFGAVDISKLPPNLIEHVLRGGPVPGIPSETLNTIIKQYMERMYYAAARAQNLDASDVEPIPEGVEHQMYLPPLSKLPQRFLSSVMDGGNLPNLNSEQTDVIKQYYYQTIPSTVEVEKGNLTDLFSPKVIQMMKLLPPGYNLSKVPPEVMKSVMAGEMPDFLSLPPDLQQYLKDNVDTLFNTLDDTPDVSIEDILRKLPKFDLPDGPTFSPYDINVVEPAVVGKKKDQNSNVHLYTAIALGTIGSATAIVLGLFCYNLKVTREASLAEAIAGGA